MQNGTNIPETPAPAAYRGEPRYEVPPQRRRDGAVADQIGGKGQQRQNVADR